MRRPALGEPVSIDLAALRMWAIELDDDGYARALAALGVLVAASRAQRASDVERWFRTHELEFELAQITSNAEYRLADALVR